MDQPKWVALVRTPDPAAVRAALLLVGAFVCWHVVRAMWLVVANWGDYDRRARAARWLALVMLAAVGAGRLLRSYR